MECNAHGPHKLAAAAVAKHGEHSCPPYDWATIGAGHARDQATRGRGPLLQASTTVFRFLRTR
ncbi:protein of unknown function [Candidatus Nitrotoga arctica]|uniref:Uncharacterized protein n=1 Tax=Candidatus Nitrotoga arctica TaxID=453162 RepID=A0ABN8ALN1_9PROT|nr:protein of unknown function [Candidatus Nitrotoga arctica]